MKELIMYRENLIRRLENIISVLREAGLRLTELDWHTPTGKDSLTPHQYMSRLAARQVNELLPTINHYLSGMKGAMPVFDEQKWLEKDYRASENWFELHDGFAGVYKQVTRKLNELDPEVWSQTARHPWHGERTLQWWVERSLNLMEETLRVFENAG